MVQKMKVTRAFVAGNKETYIVQYILDLVIIDIVILLSLSIFPHLRIPHTKFIGYTCSDIMVCTNKFCKGCTCLI